MNVSNQATGKKMPVRPKVIATQLMWREFFYTMSVDNPFYAEMDRNPVGLNSLF